MDSGFEFVEFIGIDGVCFGIVGGQSDVFAIGFGLVTGLVMLVQQFQV